MQPSIPNLPESGKEMSVDVTPAVSVTEASRKYLEEDISLNSGNSSQFIDANSPRWNLRNLNLGHQIKPHLNSLRCSIKSIKSSTPRCIPWLLTITAFLLSSLIVLALVYFLLQLKSSAPPSSSSSSNHGRFMDGDSFNLKDSSNHGHQASASELIAANANTALPVSLIEDIEPERVGGSTIESLRNFLARVRTFNLDLDYGTSDPLETAMLKSLVKLDGDYNWEDLIESKVPESEQLEEDLFDPSAHLANAFGKAFNFVKNAFNF